MRKRPLTRAPSVHPRSCNTPLGQPHSRDTCAPCKEAMNLRWHSKNILDRYGITQEDYDSMQSVVPGCGLCGSLNPGLDRKRFCIDHDHATGRVRGLLCNSCNVALSFIEDKSWSPPTAELFRDYLGT